MAMERSAELCRSEEDKHRLTLLSTGAKLSHRASTLCLMLACCECDRIPAFLFSRPYSLQRRWNSDGEVQNLPPPSASAVPQWSSGFFEETIDAGHPKFFFQATAIGLCAGHRLSQPLITIEPPPGKPFGKHSLPRANVHLFRVSEDVQTLFEFNVIEPVFDEGWLYLGVVGSWKDSIRRKCSTSDRVRLLSDLVKLVTFSFPDLYSEMLWQVVRLRSQEIIESTILPFLSVVDWQKLTDNDFTNLDEDYESLTLIRKIYSDTECLRALLRFLVHYSISQGFSTSSCIPFEYDVLQKIHFYDGDRRTGFHLIIAFKEQFCRYLSTLEVKADSFHAITYLVYPYLGAEDFTALLGFAIDFLLRSITVPLCQVKLTMLLAWWKAARGVTRQSTMGTIAESLLSTDTDFKNVFASGIEDGDLHIRVALAFAMAERNWFPSAKMLLEACVDKVGVEYSSESFEYALVSAELVNCCNVLRQDSEGELWGSQALQHRLALDLGYRADSIYLKIALADSLIGQSKYEKAEALLNDILEGTCPSVYLTITTALRLNKVRRRLGDRKALTLDKSSALWKVVDQIDSTQQVLKVECAEEVASTISLLRQGGSIESPEARDIIAAIRTKMVDDPIGWKSWPFRALERLDDVNEDPRTISRIALPTYSDDEEDSTITSMMFQTESTPQLESAYEDGTQGPRTSPMDPQELPVTLAGSPLDPQELSGTLTGSPRVPRELPGLAWIKTQSAFLPINCVRIGRFIAAFHRPPVDYFDGVLDSRELQSSIKILKPINAELSNASDVLRLSPGGRTRFMAEASTTYNSIDFSKWFGNVRKSEELIRWVQEKKETFVIRGFRTFSDVKILDDHGKGGSSLTSDISINADTVAGLEVNFSLWSQLSKTPVIHLPGENLAVIYVSKVRLKETRYPWQSKQASIYCDPPKWKTYWDLSFNDK